METTPAIDKAVDFFDAAEEEFMKACTDRVSKQFQPLFDEKLMGVRHAENGWLYALIENTDEGTCKTTFFDVGDAELASTTVERDADGTRFGFILGCDVEKVTVSSRPDGLNVSFVVSRWPEDVTSDEPWLVIVEPDGEEL